MQSGTLKTLFKICSFVFLCLGMQVAAAVDNLNCKGHFPGALSFQGEFRCTATNDDKYSLKVSSWGLSVKEGYEACKMICRGSGEIEGKYHGGGLGLGVIFGLNALIMTKAGKTCALGCAGFQASVDLSYKAIEISKY